MSNLTEALNEYKTSPDRPSLAFDILQDKEYQFVVRENKKSPGKPIFVREDGKVGFPTINSISIKIGDTVRGKIRQEEPNYFLFEIREIVS
jgi:hypothetical protein